MDFIYGYIESVNFESTIEKKTSSYLIFAIIVHILSLHVAFIYDPANSHPLIRIKK